LATGEKKLSRELCFVTAVALLTDESSFFSSPIDITMSFEQLRGFLFDFVDIYNQFLQLLTFPRQTKAEI